MRVMRLSIIFKLNRSLPHFQPYMNNAFYSVHTSFTPTLDAPECTS